MKQSVYLFLVGFVASLFFGIGIVLLDMIVGIDETESGPLEQLHFIVLIPVFLAWLLVALARGRPEIQTETQRSFSFFVAAVAFGGMGREINWGRLWGWPPEHVQLFKNISIGLVLVFIAAMLFVWIFRERTKWTSFKELLGKHFGLIVLAIFWFMISHMLEDHVIEVSNTALMEEIAETLVFLSLLAEGARQLWRRSSARVTRD